MYLFWEDTIQSIAGGNTTLSWAIKEGLSVDNAFRSRSEVKNTVE